MSTSFNLELKKEPNKQGKYQVFIRITKDRKLKRVKTSVAINRIADWNPKAKYDKFIRASEPNASVWNDALVKELNEARAIYLEDKTASLNKVVDTFKHKDKETSFLQYAKTITEEKISLGVSNGKHYQNFCNKLEAFLKANNKTDVCFGDITPSFLSKFESYLHTLTNSKFEGQRLNQNYIKALMVKFRALINRSIDIDGLMKPELNPFRSYKLTEVKVMKEKLEESEIQSIIDLELKPDTWLWHTRNCFLFSFYCAGIRVGDILQLRWTSIIEGKRLIYQMGKNHKVKDIPLVQQAQDILKIYLKPNSKPTDYIFPLLDNKADWARYTTQESKDTMPVELKKQLMNQVSSKNVLLNKSLKKIASMASINKTLTFHISRHSFAYQAMKKGTDPMIVKEALAHSSLAITERYLGEFNNKEVDNALQKVFNQDLSQPDTDKILLLLKSLDPSTREEILSKLNK